MPHLHFLALECLQEELIDLSRRFDELTQLQAPVDNQRLDYLLGDLSIGKLFDYAQAVDFLIEAKNKREFDARV
jgi:hypothetical protein